MLLLREAKDFSRCPTGTPRRRRTGTRTHAVRWWGGSGRTVRNISTAPLLEGVALALRQQLEGLEEANGQRISVLRTMGGGSRSRLWTDIVSGVLGRPLQRCAEDEISALGAGILAHVSVGATPTWASALRGNGVHRRPRRA